MSEVVSGRLEAMGLEEVEPGIILDTIENRRLLKSQTEEEGVWDWERVRDEDGQLTGYLRPLSPEERTRSRKSVHEIRKPLLVEPDNPWSDYLHPDDYPLDAWMPWWVEMRLRGWREQEAEGVPEEERRPFPVRCTQLRTDNTRCWNWAGNPDKIKLCKSHVPQTREALIQTPAYARERLLEASVAAVDNIIYLAEHADGEAVRLKANTEILDRSGVTSRTEIDINATVVQTDPAELLKEKLETLRKRHTPEVTEETADGSLPELTAGKPADVVEAEIIEETA
jgi:hypothetical protein